MAKTIIFLDFDGVLCDSVKEAYILARHAYFNLDVHEKIEDEKYNLFLKYRCLISNSWQYYYLMQILDEHYEFSTEDTEIKFNMLIKAGKDEKSDAFNKKFLAKRTELMENEFDFWNGLETPTAFLEELKQIFKNTQNCTFAILSTKNKEAIIKKFNFWNIEFNQDFIFDKKDLETRTKGEFIDDFMKFNCEYDEAILIDDNNENIESCANIKNLKAILTSWGYLKTPELGTKEAEVLKIIKEKL